MAHNNIIVVCNSCGAKNRIPKRRLRDKPICGKCRASLNVGSSVSTPVDVSDQSFHQQVLSNPEPVLVDCWAPWCGPCKMVAPVLDQLASEYAGRIKIAKLNVDENPLTASQFGIQSIPTMLLFKDGNLVDRLAGAFPKQEIERYMQKAL